MQFFFRHLDALMGYPQRSTLGGVDTLDKSGINLSLMFPTVQIRLRDTELCDKGKTGSPSAFGIPFLPEKRSDIGAA